MKLEILQFCDLILGINFLFGWGKLIIIISSLNVTIPAELIVIASLVDATPIVPPSLITKSSAIVRRPAELRYSAEVASTGVPPKARDEINPASDSYTAVETFEDIYSNDQDFFGLGEQ